MNFEFTTATRIVFGSGSSREIGAYAKSMGSTVLLTTGLPNELTASLAANLSKAKIKVKIFFVPKEPTVELVLQGVADCKANACDLIIGFGGGSAIDTGKAIAALAANPGDPLNYLEVVGQGQPLGTPPLPFIAVPTTAGTGAEVTRNAVLASTEHSVKVSLRSPSMLPKLAVIDPELTISLPPALTASTGLDALTQCIEPFVSHLSNPLTDCICREGVHLAASSLRSAFENGEDMVARMNMSLASLFGGLALANAKLGAVHGFAGPIGGIFPSAPHGAVCGRLLPFVMETNIQALSKRAPTDRALERYQELARILTGSPQATAQDGAVWVYGLTKDLTAPPLSTFGITQADFSLIIQKARNASSMKGNPIKLLDDELREILSLAL